MDDKERVKRLESVPIVSQNSEIRSSSLAATSFISIKWVERAKITTPDSIKLAN
jgi:hypothetical protein